MLEELRAKLAAEGKAELMLRVRPHAAQSQIIGFLDDGSLKLDIAAPAEDGRGNVAIVKFLAQELGIPGVHVKILSGKGARLKLIRLEIRD